MDIKRINGHAVIENMPADLLLVAPSEIDDSVSVKVLLHSDRIMDGNVCIYVNGSCCIPKGGNKSSRYFDVILIDDRYKAFYNSIDPDTNEIIRCVSDPTVPVDMICEMAEEAKEIWSHTYTTPKHAVVKSGKISYSDSDSPNYTLKAEYLRKPSDPIGLLEFN